MLAPTLAIFLLFVVVTSDAQRVDCRKFVFAPMCRGVAAKRAFSGSQAEYYLDADRKMEGAPVFYPTIPPIGMQEGLSGPGREAPGHSRQAWRPQNDQMQAQKADAMYDWYLNNRKRAREPDLAYDY